MKTTYEAILDKGQLTWVGEAPALPQPVRVKVEIEQVRTEPNGAEVVRLLEQIAASNPFAAIRDPVAWQREQREERPLPGRE